MRIAAIAALATITAGAGDAAADQFQLGTGVEVLGGLGAVNMGEQVGASSGGDSDLTGRQLGLVVSAGIARGALSGSAEAAIGIGGLNLGHIEDVYYDGSHSALGGAPVVRLGGVVRYTRDGGGAWAPIAAVGIGWQRMAASSPAGGARLDAIYLEPGAGVRYSLSPGQGSGARFDLAVRMRLCRVLRAALDGYSDGFVSPADPAVFASPGVVASYRYRF
jgi:hypothetical protein